MANGAVHRRLRDQANGAVHTLGADVTSAPGADSGRCGLRLSDTSRALARRRGGRRPGVKEVQATQPLVHYAILLSGTTLAPGSSTLAATSRSPGASLA